MVSQANPVRGNSTDFEQLKSHIHGKLVEKLDLTRISELEGESLRREIRVVVEHLCDILLRDWALLGAGDDYEPLDYGFYRWRWRCMDDFNWWRGG